MYKRIIYFLETIITRCLFSVRAEKTQSIVSNNGKESSILLRSAIWSNSFNTITSYSLLQPLNIIPASELISVRKEDYTSIKERTKRLNSISTKSQHSVFMEHFRIFAKGSIKTKPSCMRIARR
ncbi:hypothetical protein EG347_19130 [Chryseobacterium sp. G0186]|nr:hypothetical protein EG347_19130 [Chryseobacterium sp. G0186]